MLTTLARTPGRVYSRYELINSVRGYEFEGYERTIDSHVKNLRRKIERDPQKPKLVETVLGVGYRLGRPSRWLSLDRTGSLRARLALAFVAVAVTAVAALAAVILLTTRSETSKLSATDRARNRKRGRTVLADAYRRTGSWATADLAPAQVVARDADAVLWCAARTDGPSSPARCGGRGRRPRVRPDVVSHAVEVDGRSVGFADLRFPARLDAGAECASRQAVWGGAARVSARGRDRASRRGARYADVAAPLRRVVAAARRLQAGDLGARAGGAGRSGRAR